MRATIFIRRKMWPKMSAGIPLTDAAAKSG